MDERDEQTGLGVVTKSPVSALCDVTGSHFAPCDVMAHIVWKVGTKEETGLTASEGQDTLIIVTNYYGNFSNLKFYLS